MLGPGTRDPHVQHKGMCSRTRVTVVCFMMTSGLGQVGHGAEALFP